MAMGTTTIGGGNVFEQIANLLATVRETMLNTKPLETLTASVSAYGLAGILPQNFLSFSPYATTVLGRIQRAQLAGAGLLTPTTTLFSIYGMPPPP